MKKDIITFFHEFIAQVWIERKKNDLEWQDQNWEQMKEGKHDVGIVGNQEINQFGGLGKMQG